MLGLIINVASQTYYIYYNFFLFTLLTQPHYTFEKKKKAERCDYVENVMPTRATTGDDMPPGATVDFIDAEIDSANRLDYDTDKVSL